MPEEEKGGKPEVEKFSPRRGGKEGEKRSAQHRNHQQLDVRSLKKKEKRRDVVRGGGKKERASRKKTFLGSRGTKGKKKKKKKKKKKGGTPSIARERKREKTALTTRSSIRRFRVRRKERLRSGGKGERGGKAAIISLRDTMSPREKKGKGRPRIVAHPGGDSGPQTGGQRNR